MMSYNKNIMRYLLSISLLCMLAFTVLVDTAAAQEGIGAVCQGEDCSACHIVDIANTGIQWLIGVVTVLFAVLMMIAGFGLVTSGGNPSALQSAKDRFTSAIIGFVIVLAAWLMVDTLVRGLVGDEGELSNGLFWADVECWEQTDVRGLPEAVIVEIEDGALIAGGFATTSLATGTVPVAANCGFDESTLVSISGEGSHRAIASIANRYVSMKNTAAGQGINLRLTSSYRSDARQTQLWDQCPRCQAQGTVARPCSRGGGGSRHSSGVALDISSSAGRSGRCDIVRLCRSVNASFIMMYGSDSNHVHCDWGGRSGEVNISC